MLFQTALEFVNNTIWKLNKWVCKRRKYSCIHVFRITSLCIFSCLVFSFINQLLCVYELADKWSSYLSLDTEIFINFIFFQVVSYNVAINGEKCVSSKYSILSKDIKQTKYKKIVLAVIFFSCLIVLAVVGAVIFGNSTHNRQSKFGKRCKTCLYFKTKNMHLFKAPLIYM